MYINFTIAQFDHYAGFIRESLALALHNSSFAKVVLNIESIAIDSIRSCMTAVHALPINELIYPEYSSPSGEGSRRIILLSRRMFLTNFVTNMSITWFVFTTESHTSSLRRAPS